MHKTPKRQKNFNEILTGAFIAIEKSRVGDGRVQTRSSIVLVGLSKAKQNDVRRLCDRQ